jgi:DNA-directed RNA polymerase specialized sigma24 family protein/ribosome-associated translation inhibitor RaiA
MGAAVVQPRRLHHQCGFVHESMIPDSMDLQITYRNISQSAHQELEEQFHELATKHLDRHIARFAPDLVRLRIIAEEGEHASNIRKVGLHLTVPGAELLGEKTAESLLVAAKDAFADLERQLIEHLQRIRGEDEWSGMKRLKLWRRLRAAVSDRPAEERIRFMRAIRPHLPRLRRLARFEVDHLRARGQLMSDYPSADDLMDKVLTRACRDPDLLKEPQDVSRKLFRIVIDVAKEEATRDRIRRRALSLESPPPREPTDIEIDETFYDFFQPDEATKVEDLAADRFSDPEQVVIRNEMRRRFASLLANLPSAWRRAIILARIEDMPLATVARVLNTTEDEVRDWLGRADNFIRARLAEDGIVPSDSDQLSYLAKAPSLEDSVIEAGFDRVLESSE